MELLAQVGPVAADSSEETISNTRNTATRSSRPTSTKPSARSPLPLESSTDERLPTWPDNLRGIPNPALRGALFSVGQTRAVASRRQIIPSVGGLEIRFKGERWNQHDLDVWEMLLHFSRAQSCDSGTEFTANKLLKALGRGTGGADHEELKEDIARLLGGVVEITWLDSGRTFIGHIVEKAYRDEENQRYKVSFDRKMLSLFSAGYTQVDWKIRQQLRGNNLAKWLHGFYSTHASPFPYKVQTIKELCGSQVGRMTDFRKALRVALKKLEDVGAIASGGIEKDSDLLMIRRHPSQSQKRHLERKAQIANSLAFSTKGNR